MPVIPCGNKKFRIGSGPCTFKSKSSANRAQRAIYANRGGKSRRR